MLSLTNNKTNSSFGISIALKNFLHLSEWLRAQKIGTTGRSLKVLCI